MTTPALFGSDKKLARPAPTADSHPFEWVTVNGRSAKATRCRQCRRHTLTGLDDDRCAFTVEVDITPITIQGIAHAWLNNQRTFKAIQTGRTISLLRHNRWTLRNGAAGRYDVLPEHQCHTPTPAALQAPARIQAPTHTAPDPDAPAPF